MSDEPISKKPRAETSTNTTSTLTHQTTTTQTRTKQRKTSYIKQQSDKNNEIARESRERKEEKIRRQLEEIETEQGPEFESARSTLESDQQELRREGFFATTTFPRWFYQQPANNRDNEEEDDNLEDDEQDFQIALLKVKKELTAYELITKIINTYKVKLNTYYCRLTPGIDGTNTGIITFIDREDHIKFMKNYSNEHGEATTVPKKKKVKYTLIADKEYNYIDEDRLKTAISKLTGFAPIAINQSKNGYTFIDMDDKEACERAGNPPLIPLVDVTDKPHREYLNLFEASTNIYNHPYVLYASPIPPRSNTRLIMFFAKKCNVNIIDIQRKWDTNNKPSQWGHLAFATVDDARRLNDYRMTISTRKLYLGRALLHEQYQYWNSEWTEHVNLENATERKNDQMEL